MFSTGFLEAMAVGLILGFSIPVFISDWGKMMGVSMGIVFALIVVWLITGWNTFTFTAAAFVVGEHLGGRLRKYYAVKKLRKIIAENLREFQSRC